MTPNFPTNWLDSAILLTAPNTTHPRPINLETACGCIADILLTHIHLHNLHKTLAHYNFDLSKTQSSLAKTRSALNFHPILARMTWSAMSTRHLTLHNDPISSFHVVHQLKFIPTSTMNLSLLLKNYLLIAKVAVATNFWDLQKTFRLTRPLPSLHEISLMRTAP